MQSGLRGSRLFIPGSTRRTRVGTGSSLDRLGIPYDYISDQDVGRTPNLREKYDVIIFGPINGQVLRTIVRGVPKFSDSEGPIPWKKSELTPNMGLSPDQTDDIRGGMGIQGVANLQRVHRGRRVVYNRWRQCFAADRFRNGQRRFDPGSPQRCRYGVP